MPDGEAVDRLVDDAMATYRHDPERADLLFNVACTQLADPLPLYRVLYKFYNRQRRFDHAYEFASRALAEAGRQCGLPQDPLTWSPEALAAAEPLLASQCLLALKALSFITLRRGDDAGSLNHLETLLRLDPEDGSGASVVAALAESVAEAG